jgi:hypothetical protein
MKLQELAATKPTKQISKVFESYFGEKIQFDKLGVKQSKALLSNVQKLLGESRRQPGFHHSEKNPVYLKLLMVEQALKSRLSEQEMPAAGATAMQTPQDAAKQAAATVAATKDPALRAALQKAAKGQSLNPQEQKMVAGAALMKQESRLRNAYRMLKESEVQQAQVVLAAQDMVDKMQGMLEDVSELQFKELPALVDSIKNQVGPDQAQQFNTDATAALTGLLQNIQGAKAQLDQALGVVTGQAPAAPAVPGADAAMAGGAEAGADLGAEIAGAPGADAGAEAGAELAAADFGDETEPAPAGSLGRERR